MHTRIEKLLRETDNICIQYIFSSFEENLNSSNKFLIAVYANNDIGTARQVFNEWFDKGKNEKDDFLNKYHQNIEDESIIKEFIKHQNWKNDSKLSATPTILVNGYKLPDNFKIEDIKYFAKLDL